VILALSSIANASCVQGWAYGPTSDTFGFSSEDFGSSSYLGVDTRDVTPDRLGQLNLKEERGVEITMVDQDAPAGKAGLKEQDVILTLNGEKVESVEQLRRMIRETPSGRIISLGISRNGQPMTIKVQLADRKYNYVGAGKNKDYHFEMPAMPVMPDIDIPVSIVVVHSSGRSGLMVENLTPQLGDFFGVRDGRGVLIRSVEKGSRADKAGFRAGDVIVKINGEAIHDSSDFTHALRSRKENTASVGILRDKKEQTLTLPLPDRKQSESIWESMDLPDIDAETRVEMGRLQSEMAQLRPELEEAMNRVRPEVERKARDWSRQKQEIKKQMRELQRQLREQEAVMRRQLKREFDTGDGEFEF
jgi:serine protease Do